MKKFIYFILVLFALVSFTGCSGANADKNLNESETDSTIVVSPETTTKNQEPKKKVYFHAALQGAVIVATDGNKVSYQQKCESCGNLKPGKTTVYRNNGTYNSSFLCNKCKNQQTIQIKTTSIFQ